MFPIILDTSLLKIMLIGNGGATFRRLQLFDKAKADVVLYADEPNSDLEKLAGDRLVRRMPRRREYNNFQVVFVADFDDKFSAKIAKIVRKKKILLNIEDKRAFCDFHVPAMIRRGDLLLTSSTNGKSPYLARRIKDELSQKIGEEWENNLNILSQKRLEWKEQGATFRELIKLSEEFVEKEKWFSKSF